MRKMVSIPYRNPGVFAPLLKGCFLAGEKGVPILIGCEEGEHARAALAALYVEDRAILRWVCVDSLCRRKGLGRDLVEAFCSAVSSADIRSIEAYACLPTEKQGTIRDFMGKCRFRMEQSTPLYAVPLGAILYSRITQRELTPFAVSYANVSPYQWRLLLGKLARYNLPEPHSLHRLLRQESMVWLEDGKITGCILLVSDGESLEVRWLYAESQKIIAPLISAACRAASARFSVDTTVYAAATIPSVAELMKRLGGDEFQNPDDVLTFVRLLRK